MTDTTTTDNEPNRPLGLGCNEKLGAGAGARPTFDVIGFRAAVDRSRAARGLLWKHIAQQTGVSAATLSRMQDGRRPDAASLAALCAWAGIDPTNYRNPPPPPPPLPRFSADALASAIREMVKADIQGDGERYTAHETAMREQLGLLERAVQRGA